MPVSVVALTCRRVPRKVRAAPFRSGQPWLPRCRGRDWSPRAEPQRLVTLAAHRVVARLSREHLPRCVAAREQGALEGTEEERPSKTRARRCAIDAHAAVSQSAGTQPVARALQFPAAVAAGRQTRV